MILIDANLLFYAEDSLSSKHEQARTWLDERLSGTEPVGIAWISCLAYIRIFTNPRAVTAPLSMSEATEVVDRWLNQATVQLVNPSSRFWPIFQSLLNDSQAVANLSSDAYLAALAIEHDCHLCSTDEDFSRFPNLRWSNPFV